MIWIPAAIGDMQKKKAVFHDLEPDVIYQPMCIDKSGKHNINYPFRMDKTGEIHYFIPDTLHTTSFTTNRKYPLPGR